MGAVCDFSTVDGGQVPSDSLISLGNLCRNWATLQIDTGRSGVVASFPDFVYITLFKHSGNYLYRLLLWRWGCEDCYSLECHDV
jgi:hypothetical protein